MSAGVVLAGQWPDTRVGCLVPRPERCTVRGEQLRAYAERMGILATPAPVASIVAGRMIWDAPAAAEYPRAVMADAADACELRPDLARDIWHAAAGAIITAPGCDCDTPAGHRETFQAIARTIRHTFA